MKEKNYYMENKIAEKYFKSSYKNKFQESLGKIYTPESLRVKMWEKCGELGKEEKVLVISNIEFCFDLKERGFENVEFWSDSELKNKMVKQLWNYETELVDFRNINKNKQNYENMKFDLIISNPPYNKGLDLKILESVLELSDKICFVHPAGWLLDNSDYFKKIFDRNLVQNRLTEVELINGNELFDIALFMPCSINLFEKERKEKIKITDNSKHFNEIEKIWEEDDIFKIDKYGWYKNYKILKEKIEKFYSNNNFSKNNNLSLGIANIRGHVASNDFNTIVQKDYDKHINHIYDFGWEFKTENETENCYNYLKTKFARFCLSIYKLNSTNGYFLNKLPWFDFSKSWTDQECAAELGITNEELLFMIQQIPNYYPEDEEVYHKLESELNKLKLLLNKL